jgi:molybdenum-dependent DNA-binding transcriptional regulator ModE
VETPPWRDRLRAEDELLEQLEAQAERARRRRAEALKEGAEELGSVYAVAKRLGLSWTAVAHAIKKYTTE